MPRPVKVHWDKKVRAWRSDVGAVGKNGRRKTVYFREARTGDGATRPLGRSDRLLAEDALRAYLAERERRETTPSTSAIPTAEHLVQLDLAFAEKRVEKRTVEGHAKMLLKWVSFHPEEEAKPYGRRPATALDVEDLEMMLDAWERTDYLATYRARLFQSVRACWRWAGRPRKDRTPRKLMPENTRTASCATRSACSGPRRSPRTSRSSRRAPTGSCSIACGTRA